MIWGVSAFEGALVKADVYSENIAASTRAHNS